MTVSVLCVCLTLSSAGGRVFIGIYAPALEPGKIPGARPLPRGPCPCPTAPAKLEVGELRHRSPLQFSSPRNLPLCGLGSPSVGSRLAPPYPLAKAQIAGPDQRPLITRASLNVFPEHPLCTGPSLLTLSAKSLPISKHAVSEMSLPVSILQRKKQRLQEPDSPKESPLVCGTK